MLVSRSLACERLPPKVIPIWWFSLNLELCPVHTQAGNPGGSGKRAGPFAQWWDALDLAAQVYAFLAAQWILCSTTSVIVDQSSAIRKLHDVESGLHKQTACTQCFPAPGLGTRSLQCISKVARSVACKSGGAMSSRPTPPSLQIYWACSSTSVQQLRSNIMLSIFCSQNLSRRCARSPKRPCSRMNSTLSTLDKYVKSVLAEEQGCHRGECFPGTGCSRPAVSWTGLPAIPCNSGFASRFRLAFHRADDGCRARVACRITHDGYPASALTQHRRSFVLRKLLTWAPRLLGTVLPTQLASLCVS